VFTAGISLDVEENHCSTAKCSLSTKAEKENSGCCILGFNVPLVAFVLAGSSGSILNSYSPCRVCTFHSWPFF